MDETNRFNPLYSDLLDAATFYEKNSLHVLTLVRLTKAHLEEFYRRTVKGTQEISGEYYLSWDGNVRVISQMRFTAVLENESSGPSLLALKTGSVQQYQFRISQLAPTSIVMLCLLRSHSEAMPRSLLWLVMEKLNIVATRQVVEDSLGKLVESELILVQPGDMLSLENEDIAEAIDTKRAFEGRVLLARTVLRDHYQNSIQRSENRPQDVSIAVRQALRLSVELGDIDALEKIVEKIGEKVSTTTDQSWYVSQIVTAVNTNLHLFDEHKDKLLLWAAELAAEIADFRIAKNLLCQISAPSTFSKVLLCTCLTETGDHTQAAALAATLAASGNEDEQLAAHLVTLILLRCTGQIFAAKELWNGLAANQKWQNSMLYGYLLRFHELVEDFPACIEQLQASSNWFTRYGLPVSAAYTELTLAGHIARIGDNKSAIEALEKAQQLMSSTTRDQHILLNNMAVVHLLSEHPDFNYCRDLFVGAIPSSGDDYSDIVLYTNLAMVAALMKRTDIAAEACERVLEIAGAPKFADRDVFWGVSFNLRFVETTLQIGIAKRIEQFFSELQPHSLQDEYWQYRVGNVYVVPDRFQHMLSKPYHPMFLSHWTLDVDGLHALKKEPLSKHPRKSNPNE